MIRLKRIFLLMTLIILIFNASCSKRSNDISPSGKLITTYEYPKSGLVPIAQSSKTMEEQTGRLVAEAEIIRFTPNNTIVIREIHYGSKGEVIYTCESEFNTAGFKIKETKTKGRKVFEVYREWPISSRF